MAVNMLLTIALALLHLPFAVRGTEFPSECWNHAPYCFTSFTFCPEGACKYPEGVLHNPSINRGPSMVFLDHDYTLSWVERKTTDKKTVVEWRFQADREWVGTKLYVDPSQTSITFTFNNIITNATASAYREWHRSNYTTPGPLTYGDVAYLAFKQPTYFIIYDDSGEGSKNVLSTDLSDKFYVLDSSYEKLLNKVTQDNGYWCSKDKVLYTDQEKNMLEEREDSEKRWKLGVGIGVGIGVPILAVICFWLGRWFEGKKVGDRRMKSEGADGIPLSRTSTIRGLDSHVGRA